MGGGFGPGGGHGLGGHTMKRGLVLVVLVIGLGLVAAPGIFQMFTRAPGGNTMMKAFKPYMTYPEIAQFQGYMKEIGAAQHESVTTLPSLLASAHVSQSQLASQDQYVTAFDRQWPSIYADMYDNMLAKMQAMVPNYKAIDALPPFWMFPWFFVIPGVIVALVAWRALVKDRRQGGGRRHLVVLVVFGLALIAAPAVFQMWTRAPKGSQMINTFKAMPFDAAELAKVQDYFVVIGAAEGQLRTQVQPLLVSHNMSEQEVASALPAITAWHREWPTISANMAPMIGVMADNVSNFAGVAAMPPFWLFPWFFVIPGALIAALAFEARRRRPTTDLAPARPEQTTLRAPAAPATG